jgi:integrase
MGRNPKAALGADAIAAVTTNSACGEEGWATLRDRAIFSLQASTAMTTAEIIALDRGQVFGRMGAIAIVKTHLDQRIVASSTEAEDLTNRYLAAAPFELAANDPLFVNARRAPVDAQCTNRIPAPRIRARAADPRRADDTKACRRTATRGCGPAAGCGGAGARGRGLKCPPVLCKTLIECVDMGGDGNDVSTCRPRL